MRIKLDRNLYIIATNLIHYMTSTKLKRSNHDRLFLLPLVVKLVCVGAGGIGVAGAGDVRLVVVGGGNMRLLWRERRSTRDPPEILLAVKSSNKNNSYLSNPFVRLVVCAVQVLYGCDVPMTLAIQHLRHVKIECEPNENKGLRVEAELSVEEAVALSCSSCVGGIIAIPRC